MTGLWQKEAYSGCDHERATSEVIWEWTWCGLIRTLLLSKKVMSDPCCAVLRLISDPCCAVLGPMSDRFCVLRLVSYPYPFAVSKLMSDSCCAFLGLMSDSCCVFLGLMSDSCCVFLGLMSDSCCAFLGLMSDSCCAFLELMSDPCYAVSLEADVLFVLCCFYRSVLCCLGTDAWSVLRCLGTDVWTVFFFFFGVCVCLWTDVWSVWLTMEHWINARECDYRVSRRNGFLCNVCALNTTPLSSPPCLEVVSLIPQSRRKEWQNCLLS